MHGFYFSQGGSEKQQSPPTPGLPPSAGRGPETRPAGRRAARGRRDTRRSPRAPPAPTPRTRPQGRRATRRRAASPRLRGRSPKIRDPPGAEPNIARRDERHQFVAGRCDWMRPQPPLGVSLKRRSAFRVDLRALQLSGEIDVDDLRLRVEVVHLPPPFAVPVAGLLHTAEREMGLGADGGRVDRSEEHTSELQSQSNLVCRLLLEKK